MRLGVQTCGVRKRQVPSIGCFSTFKVERRPAVPSFPPTTTISRSTTPFTLFVSSSTLLISLDHHEVRRRPRRHGLRRPRRHGPVHGQLPVSSRLLVSPIATEDQSFLFVHRTDVVQCRKPPASDSSASLTAKVEHRAYSTHLVGWIWPVLLVHYSR